MASVAATIGKVRRQLNDETNGAERWSDDMLLSYFNQGRREISNIRPDVLSGNQTVNLVAGPVQTLPDDVEQLIDLTLSNGCGINRGNFHLYKAFRGPACGLETGVPVRYYYDSANPSVFYVEPDSNGAGSVVASVKRKHIDLSFAAGGYPEEKYENQVIDWMMKRAYEVDTESATSMQRQRFHEASFYRAFGITYRSDSRLQGGFNLGDKGDGDPAVVR